MSETFDVCKELLSIIEKYPTISYDELIYKSIGSTVGIDRTLRILKKKGAIKSVDIPGKKARGWAICSKS